MNRFRESLKIRLCRQLARLFQCAKSPRVPCPKCLFKQLLKDWHLPQCLFDIRTLKALAEDLLQIARELLRVRQGERSVEPAYRLDNIVGGLIGDCANRLELRKEVRRERRGNARA